jgi:hypothetical protein
MTQPTSSNRDPEFYADLTDLIVRGLVAVSGPDQRLSLTPAGVRAMEGVDPITRAYLEGQAALAFGIADAADARDG